MAEGIQQYWRSARKIAAALDPEAAQKDADEQDADMRQHLAFSQKEIWLVSVENEKTGGIDGQVSSAYPMIAARWLKEGTHVLAKEEQIAAHKAEMTARKTAIEREEANRKGVPTSQILEAILSAQQPAGRQAMRGKE